LPAFFENVIPLLLLLPSIFWGSLCQYVVHRNLIPLCIIAPVLVNNTVLIDLWFHN